MVWLEPYQGTNSCNYNIKTKVWDILWTYVDELPSFPIKLFFDNLFTSFQLLGDLKKRAIESTGTIRASCIHKSCPMIDGDGLKKKDVVLMTLVWIANSSMLIFKFILLIIMYCIAVSISYL